MEIVDKAAAAMQQVLGPETEELGRTTGVIQRRRKFPSARQLVREGRRDAQDREEVLAGDPAPG